MSALIRCGAAFLLLCTAAVSQAQASGGLFPVTNTRYGAVPGVPLLRTNGADFFLFWLSEGKLRATKLADGRDRAGHVVLNAHDSFDVAWTGTDFIVLAQQPSGKILAQRLDVSARPVDAPFSVAERGSEVTLAASSGRLLVTYKGWDEAYTELRTRLLLLSGSGKPAGMSGVLPGNSGRTAVAGNGSGFVIARMTSDGTTVTGIDRDGFVKTHTVLGPHSSDDDVALATNGSGYLLSWSETGRVVALPVSAAGTPDTPLVIDELEGHPFRDPSAVWNGNGWSVAYTGPASKTRVAHLDVAVRTVVDREQSIKTSYKPSLAAIETRVLLTSEGLGFAPAQVTTLPLANNESRDGTFTASRQTFLTTASSSSGTLVVWREQGDGRASVRAGVRSHDGNWSEYEIAADAVWRDEWLALTEASAASDGRNFVVLLARDAGITAIRLDETGRPIGAAIPLSQERHAAIAWNGLNYGIVAGAEGRLLSPNGLLSTPVAVQTGGDWVRSLASNGSGFVVTSGQTSCFIEYFCVPSGLFATRLDPDLNQRESSLVLANPASFSAGYVTPIAWNGSAYATVWDTAQGSIMASISPAATGPVVIRAAGVPLGNGRQPAASVSANGALNVLTADGKLTTINRDGTVIGRQELNYGSPTSPLGVASLPGGKLAYLASTISDVDPYHGASHVMMAILAPSLPPLPSPPRVAVAQSETRWTISWIPTAGTVNGYRLEYRIDDGSWIALERWFHAGESGISLRRPYAGSKVAVRVRAFNDGGAGDYSNVATPPIVRRRAVR